MNNQWLSDRWSREGISRKMELTIQRQNRVWMYVDFQCNPVNQICQLFISILATIAKSHYLFGNRHNTSNMMWSIVSFRVQIQTVCFCSQIIQFPCGKVSRSPISRFDSIWRGTPHYGVDTLNLTSPTWSHHNEVTNLSLACLPWYQNFASCQLSSMKLPHRSTFDFDLAIRAHGFRTN